MTGTLRASPVRRPARVRVATPRAFSLMASGLASRRVRAGGFRQTPVTSPLAPRPSGVLEHIEPGADVPFLYDAPACSPPSRAEGPPDAHWADGTQSCLPCALTPGSGRAPPVNEASAVQEAAPRRPENHYALRPGPGRSEEPHV